MAAPARGLEGRQIGRYRLRFKIAEGGMAAVYLAQLAGAHDFERWVAVKVIHPHHAEDEAFTRMLLDEALIASRIHHPNVCSVLDFGEQGGLVHLVMEYLEGETLSSVIRRAWRGPRRFPFWLAARTVADAARGLHAAHELRDADGHSFEIVHRDVSPQNLVVLYDGHTKVIDFGIARARSNISSTKVGEVKGKIAYLAPEQLGAGAIIDRQADVWALGVVLWEATMGRRLFRATTPADTARNVVMAKVPRPTAERDDYPPELEEIVLGALERNRGARFLDAKSLADALEAFLYQGGKPAGAAQVSDYMVREFDDRLMVRKALLGPDDAPGGGALEVHELHSESSIGGDVAAQETSGERLKAVVVSSPAVPDDAAIDDLLAALVDPDDPSAPLVSLGESDMVVALADLLEPVGAPSGEPGAGSPAPPASAEALASSPAGPSPGRRTSRSSMPPPVPPPSPLPPVSRVPSPSPVPSPPRASLPAQRPTPPPIRRKSSGSWRWLVAAIVIVVAGAAIYLAAVPH